MEVSVVRFDKIPEFKNWERFNGVLEKAVKDDSFEGTMRGAKVLLFVKDPDQAGPVQKAIYVSRNQLAKIALKLAEDKPDPGGLNKVRGNLTRLDQRYSPQKHKHIARIRQRVGDAFFKLTHHGKTRSEVLEAKERELREKNLEAGEMPEGLNEKGWGNIADKNKSK
jgi:hypothetical protein